MIKLLRIFNCINKRSLYFAFACISCLLVVACSSSPGDPKLGADVTQPPNTTAEIYLKQAQMSIEPTKNTWFIMALKAYVEIGQVNKAENLVLKLSNAKLPPIQRAEWLLARAKVSLLRGDIKRALRGLKYPDNWPIKPIQWRNYHQLKATLYQLENDYLHSAEQWSALRPYMQPDNTFISNRIWSSLSMLSTDEVTFHQEHTKEESLHDWLELAVLIKRLESNPLKLQQELNDWMAAHPKHESVLYPPQAILDILKQKIVVPARVALILPLSGKFAKQGRIIRDGYIQSLMDNPHHDKESELLIYDAEKYSMDALYKKLENMHVEFVVGPVQKKNIDRYQALNDGNIRTLALNLPKTLQHGHHTCYLALSPEQEATSMVDYMSQHNYKFPLLFANDNIMGHRTATAFLRAWKKTHRTGVPVYYFKSKQQLQLTVTKALDLASSMHRVDQIKKLFPDGETVEYTRRSRKDIDAIYVIGRSAELNLLKPLIEVSINPEAKPPVLFAHSRANNAKSFQKLEIKGVTFSDIPLLLEKKPQLHKEMRALWPKYSNQDKRYHALGRDAYKLTQILSNESMTTKNMHISGDTGDLSIGLNCKIKRELNFKTE